MTQHEKARRFVARKWGKTNECGQSIIAIEIADAGNNEEYCSQLEDSFSAGYFKTWRIALEDAQRGRGREKACLAISRG